jgi:capsular polysaccharide biosynthesis protein
MADTERIDSERYFVPAFLQMRKNQYLLTVLLMLGFALLGFLISLFMKPVYEAESVLITNFNVVQGDNVTEIMIDSQLGIIGELMYSKPIVDEVLESENSVGNPLDLAQLKKISTIERRLMSTLILVRDTDPEIATRIANTWVISAFTHLSEAYDHALLVSEAKETLALIEKCKDTDAFKESNLCKSLDFQKLDELISTAQQSIKQETPKALGLTKEIQISQYQLASEPQEPVQGKRANLILAGALIGLVFSFILQEMPVSKKSVRA